MRFRKKAKAEHSGRPECPDCDRPMVPVPCTVCPAPHWFCPQGCEARRSEADQ